MLVVHVHLKGKTGVIERTYDFLRNDDQDALTGVDIVVPYDEKHNYPLDEDSVVTLIQHRDLRTNH